VDLISGAKKVHYRYDYRGRLVWRQVETYNGSTWQVTAERKYLWSGWRILMELNANGEILRKFTWGPDLAGQNGGAASDLAMVLEGAGGIGGLLAVEDLDPATPETGGFLYFYDGNGNVVQVVDADTGAVEVKYEYDPYGNRINAPAPDEYDQPWRFSTKLFDGDTGLGYWGYRHYSSALGRWVSRDPIGEDGGLLLYEFCENKPTRVIDPLGLDCYVRDGNGDPGWGFQTPSGGHSWKLLPWLKVEFSTSVSYTNLRCHKCCQIGTDRAGECVWDDEQTVAANAQLVVTVTPWGGSLDVGICKGNYYIGGKVSAGFSGGASAKFRTDRCNNQEAAGEMCLRVGGIGSIALGGATTVTCKRGWWEYKFKGGVELIGTVRPEFKNCYVCDGRGTCNWTGWQSRVSGNVRLTADLLWFGNWSWVIWSGGDVFSD
jgi:RHS repeat-associated protein